MNLAELYDAIVTRAKADTGSGGLFNTTSPLVNAFYVNRTPPETGFPYVICNLVGADGRHAFNKSVFEIRVRMAVFMERQSHTVSDPLLRVSNILERLRGNWSSSSPATAPTYGFDRHPLALTAPWSGTHMIYETVFDESDDSYWQFVQQYRLFASA